MYTRAAPSRVTGVSLTKTEASGTQTLRVTWTTPQSDLTISQYQVQYRRSGSMSWHSVTLSGSPPPTSTNLTGLDASTKYSVRVRAVSVIGAGGWSVEQTLRNMYGENLCIPHTMNYIRMHLQLYLIKYFCGTYMIISAANVFYVLI